MIPNSPDCGGLSGLSVAGLIPGQGTCLGCGFSLQARCVREAGNRWFSPSLSPFFSFSLKKIINKIFKNVC